jgi:hypothetical protein
VLYWASPAQQNDVTTLQRLSREIPELEIETASNASDALTLMDAVGGFDFLFISPTLTHQEKLSAIATLRKSGTPVSIVPIVIQSQPDASTPMGAGAGDVLLLAGTFGTPLEKLARLSPRLRLAVRQVDPPSGPDAARRIETSVDKSESTDRANVERRSEIPGQWAEQHADARARFEATRHDLQARLDAQYHAALECQLATAQAALEQARRHDAGEERVWREMCRRFESERAVQRDRFAATRRDLESLLIQTKAVKTDYSALHAELAVVREALAQACVALAAERKVHDEACERIERELAGERERFVATRQDLESRLDEAKELSAEHSRLRDQLAMAEAALEEARRQHAVERSVWDEARVRYESEQADGREQLEATRRELDSLRNEAGAIADQRSRAEADLEQARNDLAQVTAIHRAEGAAWETLREQLEQRAHQADLMSAETQATLADQRRHTQRLEEVGKLAVAVTAKVEALVCSIDACATEWSAAQTPQDPNRTSAETIVELSTSARALLRQLLTFSRQQVRQPSPVDLNEGVRRAESMLIRLVGPHIELKMELGTARMIALDCHDLEQILGALVISARERLPFGGRLVVRTGLASREPAALGRGSDERGGPKLVVAVVASGYGMQAVQPKDTLESVVRRCGGTVEVDSDPGQRVALRVYLPDWMQSAPTADIA